MTFPQWRMSNVFLVNFAPAMQCCLSNVSLLVHFNAFFSPCAGSGPRLGCHCHGGWLGSRGGGRKVGQRDEDENDDHDGDGRWMKMTMTMMMVVGGVLPHH